MVLARPRLLPLSQARLMVLIQQAREHEMTEDRLRITAIKNLLDDKTEREEKSAWQSVLNDQSLQPELEDEGFQCEMRTLLLEQIEIGYRLKDEQRKSRGSRRSSRYSDPTMPITPNIGRYIFAEFGWHDIYKHVDIADELNKIAGDLKFKLDPEENRLQKLSEDDRMAFRQEKINKEYRAETKAAILGFIGFVGYMVFRFFRDYY